MSSQTVEMVRFFKRGGRHIHDVSQVAPVDLRAVLQGETERDLTQSYDKTMLWKYKVVTAFCQFFSMKKKLFHSFIVKLGVSRRQGINADSL